MCSSNGFLRSLFSPLSGRDVKGALQVSEKRSTAVILSPFAVILSAAKNLALPAQGKLREGSRSEYFQGNARFFLRDAQDRPLLLCRNSTRRSFRSITESNFILSLPLGRRICMGPCPRAKCPCRSFAPMKGIGTQDDRLGDGLFPSSFCPSWAAKRL